MQHARDDGAGRVALAASSRRRPTARSGLRRGGRLAHQAVPGTGNLPDNQHPAPWVAATQPTSLPCLEASDHLGACGPLAVLIFNVRTPPGARAPLPAHVITRYPVVGRASRTALRPRPERQCDPPSSITGTHLRKYRRTRRVRISPRLDILTGLNWPDSTWQVRAGSGATLRRSMTPLRRVPVAAGRAVCSGAGRVPPAGP